MRARIASRGVVSTAALMPANGAAKHCNAKRLTQTGATSATTPSEIIK